MLASVAPGSCAHKCSTSSVGTDRQFLLHRPLSKTVRFNVLRVIPAGASGKKGFSSF